MKNNKKNCLNCAFCVINKHKLVTFSPLSSAKQFWQHDCETLTQQERLMIEQKNYSFIGKQKREYEEWIENYNRKKEEYKNNSEKIKKTSIENIVEKLSNIGNLHLDYDVLTGHKLYNDYEMYGIKEPCPNSYYDKEYLSCWKQCWNENQINDLIQNRNELNIRCCKHFYDFKRMNTKTIELCDEEQKESIEYKRFWLSMIIAIFTLIVAIVTLIVTINN